MIFNKLNSEEKIVSQLLEDSNFREKYYQTLVKHNFGTPHLNEIVFSMGSTASFEGILESGGRELVAYAMNLANAFASNKLNQKRQVIEIVTDTEAFENFKGFLDPEQLPYTDTPLFGEVYLRFMEASISPAHHRLFVNAYESWKNYITMEQIKNESA